MLLLVGLLGGNVVVVDRLLHGCFVWLFGSGCLGLDLLRLLVLFSYSVFFYIYIYRPC